MAKPTRRGLPRPTFAVASRSAEKFEGQAIEEAKTRLRAEDSFAAAKQCRSCEEARAELADETALCEEHLRQLIGA
jgi:hypothetical protein